MAEAARGRPGRAAPEKSTAANHDSVMSMPSACDYHAACRCWSNRTRHLCGCLYPADCKLATPLPVSPHITWPGYDVRVLGLEPHPRETCERCQAVGA